MRFPHAALALLLTPACVLHWGDGDDGDIICATKVADGDVIEVRPPGPGLRNPTNLGCEYYGYGGGCRDSAPIDLPTWGDCESPCDDLDELTCIATSACRTAYDHGCLLTDEPCALETPFIGCFAVDTTGPVQGNCEGLDAQECSRHDDCLATYDVDTSGFRAFAVCTTELAPPPGPI